jgi:hypothetical protein
MPSFGWFCASTVTYPREPISFSRLFYVVSLSLSLSFSVRATRRYKWPPRTAAEFWMVLRIYCHVFSWARQFQSLVLRCLSLSLCAPPADTSDQVACCTLSVCVSPAVLSAGQYRVRTEKLALAGQKVAQRWSPLCEWRRKMVTSRHGLALVLHSATCAHMAR